MPDVAETAALLRFGLLHGYVAVPEVVTWADGQIQSRERPHPALLEVSTSGSRSPADVATELEPLATGCGEAAIVDQILALMHRALSRDAGTARRIASTLYRFAVEDVLPSGGDSEGWMIYFEDALKLARNTGIGTEQAVIEEMLRFLGQYADPALPAAGTDASHSAA